MKYAIIGDEDTVLGFGIVGVTGYVATDTEETRRAFSTILEDKDTAIVIITERLADKIRALVDKYLFTVGFPLIVEIPDRLGPKAGGSDIREMVNAAIGIKL